MRSLYDELTDKLAKDPRLTKRGGPRADLGLLLFNARAALHDLWVAADQHVRAHNTDDLGALRCAVEQLRPVFGERSG